VQIKPIASLTSAEVLELARHAAERGERIKDVNPFARGTPLRTVFSCAFAKRALELRPHAAL
jgi:hypothetical protein